MFGARWDRVRSRGARDGEAAGCGPGGVSAPSPPAHTYPRTGPPARAPGAPQLAQQVECALSSAYYYEEGIVYPTTVAAPPEALPLLDALRDAPRLSAQELLGGAAEAPAQPRRASGVVVAEADDAPTGGSAADADPDADALAVAQHLARALQPALALNVQKKLELGAGEAAALFDEQELVHVTAAGRARRDLVVVASLVSKVPNLAGLARTCEIFGARELVVADRSVTRQDEFTAISVTSERWVPMREVHPDALQT